MSAPHSNLSSSPANVFANSLKDVRRLLLSNSRTALDKHIITAHTMEWLQGRVYGWSDARKEPLLRHVHFEKFEFHSDCSVFECVLYISTLRDGLQLWRVGGHHCSCWREVQVSRLEEVTSSAVEYSTAPGVTYPPFTNGTKGDCMSSHSVHALVACRYCASVCCCSSQHVCTCINSLTCVHMYSKTERM